MKAFKKPQGASLLFLLSALAMTISTSCFAQEQSSDLDALSLQSAPEVTAPVSTSGSKLVIEGGIGTTKNRHTANSHPGRWVAVDYSLTAKLAPHVRAILSDRFDYMDISASQSGSAVNSLREAYLSWQPQGGNTIVDVGRINLRYGPSYGYNPTDFFKDGSLRSMTSSNPFAIRDNRMGSVMLRAQQLLKDGSVSFSYSPKIESSSSGETWNPDFGSTNNRHRALLEYSAKISPDVNAQVLVHKEDGHRAGVGANMTALLSDAAVAHLEWSRGSHVDPMRRALALPDAEITRNRVSAGVTYTTKSKLSITGEYQYNGFAVTEQDWQAMGASPFAKVSYLLDSQNKQELASRNAFLIYVTQKDLFVPNLDMTAFLHVNTEDQSRQMWLELRRHWSNFDMALQWQQFSGDIDSQYGMLPQSRIVQFLANYYY